MESHREKGRWRENQAIHPCLWRRTQSEFRIAHSKRQLHFVPQHLCQSLLPSYQVAGTYPEYLNTMTDSNFQYVTTTHPTHRHTHMHMHPQTRALHNTLCRVPKQCCFWCNNKVFGAINMITATLWKAMFIPNA